MVPKKKYTRRTFVAGLGSALAMTYAPGILAQTSPCAVGSYHAQYYRGTNFDQLEQSRCEAAPLDKDWSAGSVTPLGLSDNVSARWTGDFAFDEAGEYEFSATADDGIRVYVDGVRIIDEWRDQAARTFRARRTLSAGTHQVRVEWYENGGHAVCKLDWELVQTSPCAVGSYHAQYYRGTNFDQLEQSRCEAAPLNMDWGAGSISPLTHVDNVSVRWTGYFQFQAGEHEFTATADDGIRVYVNGIRIIDQWKDQARTTYKVRRTLAAGTHEVKVEYYERGGLAVCRLSWALVAPTLPSRKALNADKFVDSIGANIHVSYFSTVYGDFPMLKAKLIESKIRHIRDGAKLTPNQSYNNVVYSRHKELADVGVKTQYIVARNSEMMPMTSAKIASIEQWAGHSLEALEGPNEYPRSSPTWAQEFAQWNRLCYEAIRGNPGTAGVPFVGGSLTGDFEQVGDLSPYIDYGNFHPYPGGRNPETPGWGPNGYGSYTYNENLTREIFGSKPLYATETGYHNAINQPPGGHPPTPENVAAVYLPRIYAYYFRRGAPRTFAYEFLSQGTDLTNREWHFGIVRNNWTNKPAFNAIRNLISLLEDPTGASFSPGSLSYELTGSLTDVHSLLLQKASGRFYLLVWLGVRIYDPDARVYESVASRPLTLKLGHQASAVNVFEPNGGTSAIATHSNVYSVPVTVTEKLRIVEIA